MARRALLALAMAWAAAVAQAEPPALLLVGDSTMATRTGYGDALCQRLKPGLACLNLARGGRSTLSYRAEGLWDRALEQLRNSPPGVQAHVLIQFGHNDQPGKPGRSTNLATEFGPNLARYVAEVRAAGGVPVLVTPLSRRVFRQGRLQDDLAPWAQATRAVAQASGADLIDLHAASSAALQALGEHEADLLAMAPPPREGQAPDRAFDHTHLGARGACVFAELMLRALARQVAALRDAFVPGRACSEIAPPQPG